MELPEIEQILEDKYQAMKHVKVSDEEEDNIPSLQANPTRKSPRKHFKDAVDTVENLDIKQLIVQIRKVTKIRAHKETLSTKETEY